MNVIPCFVDETGALHSSEQPLFAVGCVIVHDIADLTDRLTTVSLNFNAKVRQQRIDALRVIREQRGGYIHVNEVSRVLASTRHHEYKFTGIRAYNKADYIALLDIFLSSGLGEFHCVVVERTEAALRHLGSDNWPVYVQVTSTLLRRRLRRPAFVLCDWQSRPRGTDLRLEDDLMRNPQVAGCVRLSSQTSPHLQVVDLLLGVVCFDWRDARGLIPPSNASTQKREVVTFVKRRLGMKPTDHFLPPGRGYIRRSVPTRFSAWQPNPARLKTPKVRAIHGVNSRHGND